MEVVDAADIVVMTKNDGEIQADVVDLTATVELPLQVDDLGHLAAGGGGGGGAGGGGGGKIQNDSDT